MRSNCWASRLSVTPGSTWTRSGDVQLSCWRWTSTWPTTLSAVPLTFGFAMAEYASRLGKSVLRSRELSGDLRGKLAGAVRGASLIGFGPEVIRRIAMVGPDLNLDTGTCGSISGWVPTTVGQPTIKVAEITVGGRTAK